MPRDLYEPTPPPPAAAVSRRAFLGLGRVRTSIDYDGATTRLREQPSRPRRMARELVRVVRPGGIVAVTAWASKGLPGRLDELLERPRAFAPRPTGAAGR